MKFSFTFIFLFLFVCAFSQRYANNRNYVTGWELGFRATASNYLGELGGRDVNTKPYLFLNTEPSQFRPGASIMLSYNLNRWLSFRSNFSYLRVKGDDALTSQPQKNHRNLSFFSNIYELSLQTEFFIKRNTAARFSSALSRYNSFWKPLGISLSAGVGGYHFNPKTNYEGEVVELQPLGTEGQGIPGNPEKYSLYSISIPMALNVYYSISKSTALHFMVCHRFLFTDYLDDVSTTYYNQDQLRAQNGELAAALADRSVDQTGEKKFWTTEGAIRGNPDSDDSFYSIEFGITQKLVKNPRSGFNKRSIFKKRRKKLKRVRVKF